MVVLRRNNDFVQMKNKAKQIKTFQTMHEKLVSTHKETVLTYIQVKKEKKANSVKDACKHLPRDLYAKIHF